MAAGVLASLGCYIVLAESREAPTRRSRAATRPASRARRDFVVEPAPPSKVFDAHGRHRLVLITFGAYNRVTDHYEDNMIVFAKPA